MSMPSSIRLRKRHAQLRRRQILLLAALLFAGSRCVPAQDQLPSAPAPVPTHNASTKPAAADDLKSANLAGTPPAHAGDELAHAHALINAGSLTEAETYLRASVAKDVTSADAHFLLGYVLFREEKPGDSLAEYTAGARFRTPSEEDLKIVSFDYVLLKDYTDASKWLTKAVTWKPDDADAWYYLGRSRYNENRFADAIAAFERALALRPRNEKAQDNLGLSYQGLQREEEAAAAYRKAISWQDAAHQDPQPYLNLGSLLVQQGKSQEALEYLQTAISISPSNPKMHEQLGLAYTDLKDYAKAQAEYEKAVSLAPAISGLHFKLGQVYQKLGLKDQAKAEFDRCAQLNASHSSDETPNPY
jgi:tetratricopeptide (TPR) repeat protein